MPFHEVTVLFFLLFCHINSHACHDVLLDLVTMILEAHQVELNLPFKVEANKFSLGLHSSPSPYLTHFLITLSTAVFDGTKMNPWYFGLG
jgi:hypothetical protein